MNIMITFKLTIRKEKMKADKTWTVFIQVLYKRKRKYLPTSMSVSKKDLTASFKIKNRLILDRGDDLIKEYKRKADMLDLEFNDMDINGVVEFLNRKNDNTELSFTKYAEGWIAGTIIKGVKNYKSAINALKKHFNRDNILFSDITVNSMKTFEKSLADRPRAQSLYTNCIVKIFNDGRDYYNDEDNNIIRIRHSLRKYTAPRQNVAQKRALPVSDIINIINLPYLDTPTRNGCPCRRDMAKDCFIMSFCLMGMNSVDMYNAKDFDGEMLTYERTKTKDRRSDNAGDGKGYNQRNSQAGIEDHPLQLLCLLFTDLNILLQLLQKLSGHIRRRLQLVNPAHDGVQRGLIQFVKHGERPGIGADKHHRRQTFEIIVFNSDNIVQADFRSVRRLFRSQTCGIARLTENCPKRSVIHIRNGDLPMNGWLCGHRFPGRFLNWRFRLNGKWFFRLYRRCGSLFRNGFR